MVGEKRESIVRDLYVGFTQSRVIAINPDLTKLEELGYNTEDKEEIEYCKEKDGVKTARIDVYFEEVKTGYKFKKAFFLEDENVTQKAKDDWSDEQIEAFNPKTQWVNQVGDSQWVLDEKDLPKRFTHFTKKNKNTEEVEVYGDKEYRIAKRGEVDLMGFLKDWLDFNFFSANTNILLDTKKMFNGNFKELQEQVGGEYALNTVQLLQVRTVDKEGEINQYQSVWKDSLPGYIMEVIRTIKFSEENIQKWKNEKYNKNDNPKGRYLKKHEEFAINVTGEYGSKDYFELVPFKKYDDSADPIASTETKVVASDSSDF